MRSRNRIVLFLFVFLFLTLSYQNCGTSGGGSGNPGAPAGGANDIPVTVSMDSAYQGKKVKIHLAFEDELQTGNIEWEISMANNAMQASSLFKEVTGSVPVVQGARSYTIEVISLAKHLLEESLSINLRLRLSANNREKFSENIGSLLSWQGLDSPYLARNFVEVVVSRAHRCALDDEGDVYCWGLAGSNRVGAGRNVGSSIPYKLSLPEKARKITVTSRSTCAVLINGSVYCWGENFRGVLGTDRLHVSEFLIEAFNGLNIVDIKGSISGYHVCAKDVDKNLYCWGGNTNGQLGLGSTSTQEIASNQVVLDNVETFAVGGEHTCAVTTQEELFCWGKNNFGQLGVSGDDSTTPTLVSSSGWGQIVAGSDHGCGLLRGQLNCWGRNTYKQLGIDVFPNKGQLYPVNIDGVAAVSHIYTAHNNTCIMDVQQRVYCWGRNNSRSLGRNSGFNILPIHIEELTGIQRLSLGEEASCALNADGILGCWGDTFGEEIGVARTKIEPIFSGFEFSNLFIGATGSLYCGADSSSTGHCWKGLLSNEARIHSKSDFIPRARPDLGIVKQIASGFAHRCYINDRDALYCWGQNASGQLGNGTTSSSPIQLEPELILSNIQSIAIANNTTCALSLNGRVHCWGDNRNGIAGLGAAIVTQPNPTELLALPEVAQLEAGAHHFCARTVGDDLWCWGLNAGPGRTSYNVPTQVTGLPEVKDLRAGRETTCFLDDSKQLWCWGASSILGGSADSAAVPRRVSGSSVISHFTLSSNLCYVVRGEKQVRCLGQNNYGQSGSMGLEYRVYQQVLAFPSQDIDLEDLRCAEQACFMIDTQSQVYAWGSIVEEKSYIEF